MWEYKLDKFLLCFIPQGTLQTKAEICSPLSPGIARKVPRIKTTVSLVTTQVGSLEVWHGCPIFRDVPEKVPEMEMTT